MKLVVILKYHCIKTGAKREYNQLINRYFSSTYSNQDKRAIEAQIEALKFFLENADFNKLRSEYPELSGMTQLAVTLIVPENHYNTKIAYHDRIIQPEWKFD